MRMLLCKMPLLNQISCRLIQDTRSQSSRYLSINLIRSNNSQIILKVQFWTRKRVCWRQLKTRHAPMDQLFLGQITTGICKSVGLTHLITAIILNFNPISSQIPRKLSNQGIEGLQLEISTAHQVNQTKVESVLKMKKKKKSLGKKRKFHSLRIILLLQRKCKTTWPANFYLKITTNYETLLFLGSLISSWTN
jgi:hypothetical protein